MDIITDGEKAGPRVLALGTFDGVHRGHQELIRQGRILADQCGAKLRVCTFDRHPLQVVRPEAAPPPLQTPGQQAEIMRRCGVDELRIFSFTPEMANTEPEDFLAMVEGECELAGLVAGWNYRFGRKGRGDAQMLREEGERRGWQVIIVPPVRDEEGAIISSTAIRELLRRGDTEKARQMLGHDEFLNFALESK